MPQNAGMEPSMAGRRASDKKGEEGSDGGKKEKRKTISSASKRPVTATGVPPNRVRRPTETSSIFDCRKQVEQNLRGPFGLPARHFGLRRSP